MRNPVVMRWINHMVERIALTGPQVCCALNFTEWARDIGPIAFLFNSNYELGDTEIQVFGKPVFHAYDDAYGVFEARLFCFHVQFDAQANMEEVDWPETDFEAELPF